MFNTLLAKALSIDIPAPAGAPPQAEVAEIVLIRGADGTARFYAEPSARSLPGPKLPEYPDTPESPLPALREDGNGADPSSATHRKLLGPAAVSPSAISISKPKRTGVLARISLLWRAMTPLCTPWHPG